MGQGSQLLSAGRRIRIFREARGWTRGELAERLGVSRSAISHWESGARRPPLDMLARILDAFEISAASFFGLDLREAS